METPNELEDYIETGGKIIDLVDELLAGCLSTFGALFADSLYNTLT